MDSAAEVKVLAIASQVQAHDLQRSLSRLRVRLTCAETFEQIGQLRRRGQLFEVVLLPENLDGMQWWPMWGELCLLTPRPSILVYARQPGIQLWTAVLDLGGYDIVSEPFVQPELEAALFHAAQDYRRRCISERP